jgi:hypothetical protein
MSYRADPLRRRFTFGLLALLVVALALFLLRQCHPPPIQSRPLSGAPLPKRPSKPKTAQTEEIETNKKEREFQLALNTVRLKPGESAIVSYWESLPGMNMEMMVATPQPQADGRIGMKITVIHFPMEALKQLEEEGLCPRDLAMTHVRTVSSLQNLMSFVSELSKREGMRIGFGEMGSGFHPNGDSGVTFGGTRDGGPALFNLRLSPAQRSDGDDLDLGIDFKERRPASKE